MILVIAEKPSVAQSIASVLGATARKNGYLEGGGYQVSWCYGHLAELAEAAAYDAGYEKWSISDLPILPETFQLTIQQEKQKQFEILKTLLCAYTTNEVVNACDAGREGELIFRNVYELSGCKKPMKRLWISSMEDAAIREGFQNLRPGDEFDGLYQSALCRSRADWLVGINASRFFSLTYGCKLNIGRVMSPTLALLVQREAEISAFVPYIYYTVQLDLGGFQAVSEKYDQQQDTQALASRCAGPALVQSVDRKKKSEKAPALYDLTTLQRDANRLLGYTAQQTLDYLQALYEKKLCSYPRTDSRYLTEDMEENLPAYIGAACTILGSSPPGEIHARQVCDSTKVSDHHAVIPTLTAAGCSCDELPAGEREILRMVSQALLRGVSDAFRYLDTKAVFVCDDETFTAKGRTVLDPGWTVYAPEHEKKEAFLPEMAEGQSFPVKSVSVKQGKTTPPKHFTEDTLLSAMETAGAKDMPSDAERKGLGTPATRAGILEKLVSTGLASRKKSKKVTSLLPTALGRALITVLPEQLQSPQLTAEWEHRLKQIEHGEEPKGFLDDIGTMLKTLIETYEPVSGADVLFPSRRQAVGKCPRCGKNVVEWEKGYSCEDRTCGFSLWKNSFFFTAKRIPFTPELAAALLRDGRASLHGCYSEKTGKTYDADAVLTDDGKKAGFRIEFPKKEGKKK